MGCDKDMFTDFGYTKEEAMKLNNEIEQLKADINEFYGDDNYFDRVVLGKNVHITE